MQKAACLLFFSLLWLTSLAAQEAQSNAVSIYWHVSIGDAAENARYADIIARTSLIEFQQKGFVVTPAGKIESFAGSDVPDDVSEFEKKTLPRLQENAAGAKSSFVVAILYHGDAALATVTVYAWNRNGKMVLSYQDRVRSGLELYTRMTKSAEQFASGAGKVESTAQTAGTTGDEPQKRGFVQQVVLYSWDEGAEIYVNKVIRVGVIIDGKLTLPYMPMPLQTRFVVEKRKNGYYSDTEEFILDEEWMELRLSPLEKITTHESVFLYSLGQFAGFGLGYNYNIMPKRIFLGAENYFYIQFGDSDQSNPVFHDDIRILAGYYLLNEPDIPIRVNLTTGAGVVLTFLSIPNAPIYTDFYFNLVNVSLEFRAWNTIVFLREEFKLGLGLGDNLLGMKFFMLGGRVPPVTFGLKMPF